MEQKGLDEIEETFLGEEIIEDEVSDMTEAKQTKASAKKKATSKKAEKNVEEKVEKKEKVTAAKQDEVTISPVETKAENTKTVEAKVTTAATEEAKVEPWGKDPAEPTGNNAWAILSGVLVVLLLISVFTQGFSFGDATSMKSGSEIGLGAAEELVQEYVNTNLLPEPFTAGLVHSEELRELYKVTLSVNGQEIDSYITKDGNLFFPQGLEIDETEEDAGTELEAAVQRFDVPVDDDAFKGNADAPVTIIEFSDYECPFCARFYSETYSQLLEEYVDTGVARIVFRDFPLSFHPNAEAAAVAAECAGEQGDYFAMHDLLFENQAAGFSDELYVELAEELGLDMEAFATCLEDPKMAEEVAADMAEGSEFGVSGTPAFFVNGEMLSGAQPYEVFEAAINRALAELEEEEVVAEGSDNMEAGEDMGHGDDMAAEEAMEEGVAEETGENVVEVAQTGNTVVVTLDAKKWRFTPSEVSVSVGDAVELTVLPQDMGDFTFSIEGHGVEETISGETLTSFTASEAGSFEYSCSSCEAWRGMTGTLIVE